MTSKANTNNTYKNSLEFYGYSITLERELSLNCVDTYIIEHNLSYLKDKDTKCRSLEQLREIQDYLRWRKERS